MAFDEVRLEDLPAFDLVIGDVRECFPEKLRHPLEIGESALVVSLENVHDCVHFSFVVRRGVIVPVDVFGDCAHGALSLVGGVYRNLENLYNKLSKKSMVSHNNFPAPDSATLLLHALIFIQRVDGYAILLNFHNWYTPF